MYDPKETEKMYDWLMAISNTCLIAPNKEEFGKMIDYPAIKNNSLQKKFKPKGEMKAFEIHSTFHELEHLVSEKSDGLIKLSDWLEEYKKASDSYSKTFWEGEKVNKKQKALLGYILYKYIEKLLKKMYNCFVRGDFYGFKKIHLRYS